MRPTYTPPLGQIPSFPCVYDGQKIDEEFLIQRTGLLERSDSQRIPRPEYLDEFGTGYGRKGADAQRKIIETVIRTCEAHNINWCLWHWKDVHGMGLWHMREGTPWLNWLDKAGARTLREGSGNAIKAYLEQVEAFLPLDRGQRTWLSRETRRDLEMLTLRRLVEQMKDLTPAELAALGRSFNSENFEVDETMAQALRQIMQAAPHSPSDSPPGSALGPG
jgi:hypothetical protein